MINKCNFILVAVTLLCVQTLGENRSPVVGKDMQKALQSDSPYRALKDVPIQDIELTDGFWNDRFELIKNVTIPKMFEYFHAETASHWRNFLIAAGMQEGKWYGTYWHDGDFYKWLESVVYVYQITRDKELDRLMDSVIEVIAKVQKPDGYISTYIILNKKERWQNKQHHELYNLGHLMTASARHYEATGKTNFLEVGKKTGDYLFDTFCVDRPARLNPFGFNPSNIMGAVDLYRATRNKKYLTLADTFITMRGTTKIGETISYEEARQHSNPPGDDNNQDHIPFRQETEAVGHSVTAGYLYCGAADTYMETGDKSLLTALNRIWRDVTHRKISIHGGVGPVPKGVSIRNDKVHEAFDFAYSLPNRVAYNETCANIANAMWNWRMFQIRPDAKYTDLVERVMYNSGLSGLGLDGDSFYYNNPLRRLGSDVPLGGWNEKHARTKHIHCYCCPPQLARTQAKMRKFFYSIGKNERALWVNMYAANRLNTTLSDGTPVVLTQKTEYPWDGSVTLEIETDGEFVLYLRIPDWAKGTTVQINGKKLSSVSVGSYLRVSRNWKKGNAAQIDFPMRIQRIKANPLVEQLRNQIAIQRGPIVYCLESVGLPESINILDIQFRNDTTLTAEFKRKLLGGVTALRGNVSYTHDPEWSQSPYNALHLYKEITPLIEKPLQVQLIPYFAWSNRGPSQMTVWFPYAH
ncbi:MAG: glycoside hydrolase family 127 protein [Planctomycetota bacterium]|jgi:DUF1680 family protein